jgi:hypothetical protein
MDADRAGGRNAQSLLTDPLQSTGQVTLPTARLAPGLTERIFPAFIQSRTWRQASLPLPQREIPGQPIPSGQIRYDSLRSTIL